MLDYGFGLSLHSNLHGQLWVENELLKIFFVDQVLKVSSEGSAVYCEVAPPYVEGIVIEIQALLG